MPLSLESFIGGLTDLSTALRPAQFMVILFIIIMAFMAIKVLQMPEMIWVSAAFSVNFLHIALILLSEQNSLFANVDGIIRNLSLFNSFLLFRGAIVWYFNNERIDERKKKIYSYINLYSFFLVGVATTFIESPKNLVTSIVAFYGFFSMITFIYLFIHRAAKNNKSARGLLSLGFYIWAGIQFYSFAPASIHNIGYLVSLIAKTFILFGIFSWYLQRVKETEGKIKIEIKKREYEQNAKEQFEKSSTFFKDILASIFHEVIIPLRHLESSLDELASALPRFAMRNKFENVENCYEQIKTIILVNRKTYKDKEYDKSMQFDVEVETFSIGNKRIITSVNTLIEFAKKSFKKNYRRYLNQGESSIIESNFSQGLDIDCTFVRKCYIECNPSEIVQIFVNLFKNSFESYKDNKEQKKVTVKTRISKEEPKKVIVVIEDSGEGISPENIDQIWIQGFSTKEVDSNNLDRGNGLFVVKNIIERQEIGVILVESPIKEKDGKEYGTRFTIEFKLRELPKSN